MRTLAIGVFTVNPISAARKEELAALFEAPVYQIDTWDHIKGRRSWYGEHLTQLNKDLLFTPEDYVGARLERITQGTGLTIAMHSPYVVKRTQQNVRILYATVVDTQCLNVRWAQRLVLRGIANDQDVYSTIWGFDYNDLGENDDLSRFDPRIAAAVLRAFRGNIPRLSAAEKRYYPETTTCGRNVSNQQLVTRSSERTTVG